MLNDGFKGPLIIRGETWIGELIYISDYSVEAAPTQFADGLVLFVAQTACYSTGKNRFESYAWRSEEESELTASA